VLEAGVSPPVAVRLRWGLVHDRSAA